MYQYIKHIYRSFKALSAFRYDIFRYIFHSGMSGNMKNDSIRNYTITRTYHSLEKSLSYKKRDYNRGWGDAFRVASLFQVAKNKNSIKTQDLFGLNVLRKFISDAKNKKHVKAQELKAKVDTYNDPIEENHGAKLLDVKDLNLGILKNPEGFFKSRHSIRYFENRKVEHHIIQKAINLAISSPSACNRQPWKVYLTDKPELRDLALENQSGNAGFGSQIPHLAIITTDLCAYEAAEERNASYVDGSLFSMSFIYALHSLGIGSCSLNWSRMPKHDKALRDKIKIDSSHNIIMMIGFGYPDLEGKICYSSRMPLDQVLIKMEKNE